MYAERHSRLPGSFIWTRQESESGEVDTLRILPDGCVDLLFHDGTFQVAGPDSSASLIHGTPGRQWTAIRFAPGTGGRILGVPVAEILDQQPLLDQIWPAALVRSWESRMAGSLDKAAALERLVCSRSADLVQDRWPSLVTAMLRAGSDVRAVATELGWGERRLHRRSLDAFGYGPALLRRILRFQRALASARTAPTLAMVAADCGYADQAHLAREARALAGVPMSQLVDGPGRHGPPVSQPGS